MQQAYVWAAARFWSLLRILGSIQPSRACTHLCLHGFGKAVVAVTHNIEKHAAVVGNLPLRVPSQLACQLRTVSSQPAGHCGCWGCVCLSICSRCGCGHQ
jgi:hypothetical protein